MSEEQTRGQAATQLLEHPLMAEALDIIDEALTEQWITSTSTEAREEIWYTLQGAKRFQHFLQVVIETGDYAKALEEKKNATS